MWLSASCFVFAAVVFFITGLNSERKGRTDGARACYKISTVLCASAVISLFCVHV